MLAVTASLCYGGEDVGSGGPWLCLWAEISAGPWMVHSNVIEKIKLLAVKMVFWKGKRGKFSPVLTVTAPLCYGGEGVGDNGS